jgi:Uma2 family endonuclease
MASVTIESMQSDDIDTADRPCEDMGGQEWEKLMGATETDVMSVLTILMGHFAMTHRLGRVEVEMLFDLGGPKRHFLKPDVAFVSAQRWSLSKKIPSKNAFQIVPDLVVEVVSPTNSAYEVEGKVVEYLQAGVRQVWLVYAITERIYIHDSLSSVKIVSGDGELDGGEIIPGFKLPASRLFEVEAEPD